MYEQEACACTVPAQSCQSKRSAPLVPKQLGGRRPSQRIRQAAALEEWRCDVEAACWSRNRRVAQQLDHVAVPLRSKSRITCRSHRKVRK